MLNLPLNFAQKGIAHLALLLIVLAGIVVGTSIVQQRTNITPRAECEEDCEPAPEEITYPDPEPESETVRREREEEPAPEEPRDEEPTSPPDDEPTPPPDEEPVAEVTPECTDPDYSYCDENTGNEVYKTGGYFDPNIGECVYDYLPVGSCSEEPKDNTVAENIQQFLENTVEGINNTAGGIIENLCESCREDRIEGEIAKAENELGDIPEYVNDPKNIEEARKSLTQELGLPEDATDEQIAEKYSTFTSDLGFTVDNESPGNYQIIIAGTSRYGRGFASPSLAALILNDRARGVLGAADIALPCLPGVTNIGFSSNNCMPGREAPAPCPESGISQFSGVPCQPQVIIDLPIPEDIPINSFPLPCDDDPLCDIGNVVVATELNLPINDGINPCPKLDKVMSSSCEIPPGLIGDILEAKKPVEIDQNIVAALNPRTRTLRLDEDSLSPDDQYDPVEVPIGPDLTLIELSEKDFDPVTGYPTDETITRLGDTYVGKGGFKYVVKDDNGIITALFRDNDSPELVDLNKAQIKFYLENQDKLEGVAPITGLVYKKDRWGRTEVIGTQSEDAGISLNDYDKPIAEEAIEKLVQQQINNQRNTGMGHGDLVRKTMEGSGEWEMNTGNILVRDFINEYGEIDQELTLIDYHGIFNGTVTDELVAENRGRRVLIRRDIHGTAEDPNFRNQEPFWLGAALLDRNRQIEEKSQVKAKPAKEENAVMKKLKELIGK